MESEDGAGFRSRGLGIGAFLLAQACVITLLFLGPTSPLRVPLLVATAALLLFAGSWLAWVTFGPNSKRE